MRLINYLLILSIASIFISGCVDRDFAEPPFPGTTEPDIPADKILSIADLKDLRAAGQEFHEVAQDKYLRGTVVADDQSGNIYKSLVIQDETGGISILLDDVELWNRYFVGKRVYVYLQDIWLGDYNNLPQMGFEPVGGNMARIPAELIGTVLTVGPTIGEPEADVTTIGALNDSQLNTLIQLNEVQFSSGSANDSYADGLTQTTVNHYLEDCNGNEIVVRTSGFASFAEEITPDGKGSLKAIYTIFGTTKQLTLRDTDDVNLNDARCGTGGGGGGGGGTAVTIDAGKVSSIQSVLAQRVDGQETNINTDTYIHGIIVSSDETGNFFKSLVIQDETGGIALLVNQFDIHLNFEIGTSVYVHLQDLFVSDYNGLPQLGYAPSTESVKRVPENRLSEVVLLSETNFQLNASELNITDLNSSHLNTYIQLSEVEFESSTLGSTYANASETMALNHNLVDCDGNTLILRTSGFSDFADDRLPTDNGTIKGIIQIFNGDYQLYINYPEDVRFNMPRCSGGGGGGGGGDDQFNLDFESQADFEDVKQDGWVNVATKGDRVWQKRSFDGNGFAEVRAFQDPNPATEAWLVSPMINTSEKGNLQFLSANAFHAHDGLSILYSENFSGDVTTATWNNVNATLAVESTGNYNWVDSGNINLSALGSNIHLAFMYTGTSSSNTTTFRLDDIVIQ